MGLSTTGFKEAGEEMAQPAENLEGRVKYRIEGEMCCANCVAQMERALSATPGIGPTTINFTTKTVWLPESMAAEAEAIMAKIEPGISLVPVQANKDPRSVEPEKNWLNREVPRIILAAVLLVIGLGFSQRWQGAMGEVAGYAVYLVAYALVGYEVLSKAARNIVRGAVLDENFLMALATVGAIAIHQLSEAVGVMLFYSIGEYIQDRAVERSRHSIQALLNIRPDYANLIQQLDVIKVDPEDVQVGQLILVRPGEKVPLDGQILNGNSFLDTSALTGESVPRRVEAGDRVLAGMINQSGVLTVRVTKRFAESSVQKILDLVENASARKARTEKFITTFARYYTPLVVVTALGIAFMPPLFLGGALRDWLYRAMTILVISCPCALVISVPLGYFGGIGGASRHGILVKGANFLEALTKVSTVVFDKTGTLTQGVFEVVAVNVADGFTQDHLLEVAATAEAHSSHPIAKSIREKYAAVVDTQIIDGFEEVSGKGIRVSLRGQEVLVGKAELLTGRGVSVPSGLDHSTGTTVHVAVAGRYAGHLVIADKLKAGARETIQRLNRAGIKTVMLTGDHETVAQAVATDLGVTECHADLLPEDKVVWLEKLIEAARGQGQGKVVFVGDGINDAPVLTRADIGVAMGGLGSDAAIEAADVVLMEDQPEKLLSAISIAGFTKKIIWENIVFALAIKLGFIILGAFGVANMWEAVFADVGVALLAILNATRVRAYSVSGVSNPGQVRALAVLDGSSAK